MVVRRGGVVPYRRGAELLEVDEVRPEMVLGDGMDFAGGCFEKEAGK